MSQMVRKKRSLFCASCGAVATFRRQGNQATHCHKHAPAGMKKVLSYCQVVACTRRAGFGFPEEKRATRCSDHKEGRPAFGRPACTFMKNEVQCTYQPTMGWENEQPTRCAEHAEDG